MWDQQEDLDFKSLYTAWQHCQKRKAGKVPAQRYEMNGLENLFDTLQQLQQGTYQTTSSYCFVTKKPKLREIHAANFKDRVVHHLLVPQLEALWEPIFIEDVYSNRKNKGTHKAVKRLQKWMRKVDTHYFIQLDIKNFFYSVQQSVLMNLIKKGLNKAINKNKISKEKAEFLFWLSGIFIQADYKNAIELDKKLSAKVPKHKQLKQQPKGQGLPIGNLTSQFYANVYMNELDQFIKHQLKCRYYLRYADDFILLATTASQLKVWQNKMIVFLQNHLQLKLKNRVQPQAIDQGTDFLGYIIRPYYILVRKRVIYNLKEKLNQFEKEFLQNNIQQPVRVGVDSNINRCFIYDDILNVESVRLIALDSDPNASIATLISTLASYLSHFKHANSLKLIHSIFKHYAWLNQLFVFDVSRWKLLPKYQPPKHYTFKQQIKFFKEQYPHATLKIQKGREMITIKPKLIHFNNTVKQVNIFQTGYNQIGCQQRQAQHIILRPLL